MGSPFPFSAGDVLTAANMNSIGEWTAFTPTWFNITIGNATQKAYYAVVNEIVHVAGEFIFGSTTSFTGSIGFESPVAVNGTVLGNFTGVGQVIVNGNQFGMAQRFGDYLYFYSLNAGTATGAANMPNMNATSPKTFTTGDDIRWYLTYATT